MIYALVSFILVLSAMPLARLIAIKAGFVDEPGGRKQHEAPVPPIGGLVVLPVFMLVALAGGFDIGALWPLFTGIFILLGVGALDDYAHVPAWPKFGLQFVAATLVVLAGDARVYQLGDMFGWGAIGLDFISIPFSIIAAVLLINAINLMDGLDGLSGGYTFIALLWFTLACMAGGRIVDAGTMMILMGALGGFLFYNMRTPFRPRASVFLGDAGSMALGLCLAWFAMKITQEEPVRVIEPIAVAWIFALPIMDTCAQFYRRMRNGRHPFSPDRGHFHHHFIDAGFPAGQAVALILALVFVLGGLGYNTLLLGVAQPFLTILWIALLFTHMGVSYKPERYTRLLSKIHNLRH